MKYSITSLLALSGATVLALAPALQAGTHKRASAPIVITPPALRDGSNASRAPFPSARPENDVTPPNGEPFDLSLPPNTPSTTPDPEATPPARFAVMQPRVDPGLMPTGRPSVAAAASLEVARMPASIRSTQFENRDNLVDNVRVRIRQSDAAVSELRRTESDMSSQGRSQFDTGRDEVRAREKDLNRALRTAADASSSTWDSARAELATAYQAYATAVSRLDATVGVAPAQR